jgi:hypothetical protein
MVVKVVEMGEREHSDNASRSCNSQVGLRGSYLVGRLNGEGGREGGERARERKAEQERGRQRKREEGRGRERKAEEEREGE